jgi:outer membrane protein OmpA-like peptidoglycan-associated protein
MSPAKLFLLVCLGSILSACSSQTQRNTADLGSGTNVSKSEPTSEAPPTPPPVRIEDQHDAINWIDPGPADLPPAPRPAPAEAPAPAPVPETASAPAPAPEPDDTPRNYPTDVLPNRDDLIGQAVVYPEWPDNIVNDDGPVDVADLGPIPFEPGTDLFALEELMDRGDGVTNREIFADPATDRIPDNRPDISGPLTFGDDKADARKIDTRPDVSGPKVYGDDDGKSISKDNRPDVSDPVIRKETVSVELSADPLFNFDKFNVRQDMQDRLDRLITGLSDADYTVIEAVGHTDRIGTVAYNQTLSERRAEAVKAYLVSKGIPSDRIQASGRGKKEPVTTDCNKKKGKSLILCLEPDRRVEVSVKAHRTK